MTAWISAAREHRTLLSAFQCAPILPPRFGDRTDFHRRTHWAHKLQRRIHGLKPPLRAPEMLLVCLAQGQAQIDALVWFEMKLAADSETRMEVAVGALAVHRNLQGSGLGREGLDEIKSAAATWARDRAPVVTQAYMTAEVHTKNQACISMISGQGWTPLGDANIEGNRLWGAAYAV